MTWLVWALFALGAAALAWWFRRTPWRADQKPDPMEGHFAARRRERAAAAADWERDFRRAQDLPESAPATTKLGRGEAVVPVSRMLTTANRLLWPPTLNALNLTTPIEVEIAQFKGRPPYELSVLKPAVPRPKPAASITVIQD